MMMKFAPKPTPVIAPSTPLRLAALFALTLSAGCATAPQSPITIFPETPPVPQQPASPPPDARIALCAPNYNKCALLDGTGALVVDKAFDTLGAFHGTLASFGENEKYGVIDRAGKIIIPPAHDELLILGEGRYVWATDRGGSEAQTTDPLQTLYDAQGHEVLHLQGRIKPGFWGGHVYYITCASGDDSCVTTFLDDKGQAIAEFARFHGDIDYADDMQSWAIASVDGATFGVVDTALRWTVPPRFKSLARVRDMFHVRPTRDQFDGVLQARDESGSSLIDLHGKTLVPAGSYGRFDYDGGPFIEGMRTDPETGRLTYGCSPYFRRDGSIVALPEGMCAYYLSGMLRTNATSFRDAAGRHGLLDESGAVLFLPAWELFYPLNTDYLVVREMTHDPDHRYRYGVIDWRGKIILPLQPALILEKFGVINGAVLAGLFDFDPQVRRMRYGLLGLDGEWKIPPRYFSAEAISPDLLVFEERSGGQAAYRFFTPRGQELPLVSDTEPQSFGQWNDTSQHFFIFGRVIDATTNPPGRLYGVANGKGQIVIAADYEQDAISTLGRPDGPWLLKQRITGRDRWDGNRVIRLIDSSGHPLGELQADGVDMPFQGHPKFKDGAIVFYQGADALLVNTLGKVLASFEALFPALTEPADDLPNDTKPDSTK
jgi:hypothetical protein